MGGERVRAYDRLLRQRLRSATARLPRVDGQVLRPPGMEPVGEAGGFYYERRGGMFSAALPGRLADHPEGCCLMALYPDDLPGARAGDEYALPGARYRILNVRDRGAYHTYQLEAIEWQD
jgi:hypothetical protein